MKKKQLLKKYGKLLKFSLFYIALVMAALIISDKVTSTKTNLTPKAASNPGRITWNGREWFLYGVNVPWYNWRCDFGCNATNAKSGGVSTNLAIIDDGLKKVADSGSHVVRWWVFPGDAWQINRDASGAPTSLNAAVFPDFDAALQLAEKYDLYYNFVLFSAPTHIPASWQTDANQRTKLAEIVGGLAARYKGHPRIISWEIYNEPENDIWNNRFAEQPVVDTVTALTTSIHTQSPGVLVTVGNLMADGMDMFVSSGLDYYSPHWYDYMSGGNYCMMCHDAAYYRSLWNLDKPIVVGEYYTGVSSTSPYSSTVRNTHWYNAGYAGAWSWSLFPDKTSDKMAIDFAAASTFTSGKTDVGPRLLTQSPTPVPTLTPTPSTTPMPSVTPAPSPIVSTAPSVLITAPVNNSIVTGGRNTTLTATINHTAKIARASFVVNGSTTVCTVTKVSTKFSCRWRPARDPGVRYTISARVTDVNGNVGSSIIYVTTR